MKKTSVKHLAIFGFSVLLLGFFFSVLLSVFLLHNFDHVKRNGEIYSDTYSSLLRLKDATESLLTTNNLVRHKTTWLETVSECDTKLKDLKPIIRQDHKDKFSQVKKFWVVIKSETFTLNETLSQPLFQSKHSLENPILRRLGQHFQDNITNEKYSILHNATNSIGLLTQYEKFILDDFEEILTSQQVYSMHILKNVKYAASLFPFIIFLVLLLFSLFVGKWIQQIEKNLALKENELQLAHKQLEKRVIERTAQLKSEVDERQKLERELIKEKDFLGAILDNIEDGIVACNSDGVLTVFNRASVKFHDLPLREIPPDQWAQYYDLYFADGETPMTRDDIPLFRAFNGENIHDVEMIIAPPKGPNRTIQASGQPLLDKEGNIGGAVVSMHDITERKQAEEELKIANKKLKELDRLKSMFIASMSHELRTPLNSILGFTSIILDGLSGEINDRQKDQLARVKSNGERLLAMITDIIDISKIESGRTQIVTHDFFFYDVIDEVIKSLQLQLKKAGVTLKLNVPKELKMHADDQRLFQCVLNLLNNAVKFTEIGGTVSVTACEEEATVTIAVSDTGIGIAENDLVRVFQPFERIESHMSVAAGGTGLGLYLTKKLVNEVLRGDIEAESKVGIGSTFKIIMPQNLDS